MWESPTALWSRLKLGREEYLQRLITTLVADGDPPPWNTPRPPGDRGALFFRLLDDAAHGDSETGARRAEPEAFVDEYRLPKLEEAAQNGWPDWAVLWPDRLWVIELKTERASHRDDQLPYYLRLAAAAHPGLALDLTYITGPLVKPAPEILTGQRYSHLTWEQVVPLVDAVWGHDDSPEVAAYVEMVGMIIDNLERLRPSQQREMVLAAGPEQPVGPQSPETLSVDDLDLLELARATAADGRQRGIGATSPRGLELLRDRARAQIETLPPDDATRFVTPWLWRAGRTGGSALTPEGEEFGYEVRFSRSKVRT